MNSEPWGKPQTHTLSDNRLHLQHGPIDLIIKADGDRTQVADGYQAAISRFQNVLTELVGELDLLRRPLIEKRPPLRMPIAKRMAVACWPHRANIITPMASVAGAVADDILDVMLQTSPELHTAFVNNGGDIACHVSVGRGLRIGVVKDLHKAVPEGVIPINHSCGIATSGWRGRSFSLGIADAVTVIAKNAAEADAAATMVANAVNIDAATIARQPAQTLDPDSDLGGLLVTTGVGSLSATQIETALQSGVKIAESLLDKNLIAGALLSLNGTWRAVQKTHAKMLS